MATVLVFLGWQSLFSQPFKKAPITTTIQGRVKKNGDPPGTVLSWINPHR